MAAIIQVRLLILKEDGFSIRMAKARPILVETPPIKLMYVEEFSRIDEAFAREKQVQGWSRKKKESLINGRFHDLHELARCRG